jgi:hypothetical protein
MTALDAGEDVTRPGLGSSSFCKLEFGALTPYIFADVRQDGLGV